MRKKEILQKVAHPFVDYFGEENEKLYDRYLKKNIKPSDKEISNALVQFGKSERVRNYRKDFIEDYKRFKNNEFESKEETKRRIKQSFPDGMLAGGLLGVPLAGAGYGISKMLHSKNPKLIGGLIHGGSILGTGLYNYLHTKKEGPKKIKPFVSKKEYEYNMNLLKPNTKEHRKTIDLIKRDYND